MIERLRNLTLMECLKISLTLIMDQGIEIGLGLETEEIEDIEDHHRIRELIEGIEEEEMINYPTLPYSRGPQREV